MAQKKSTAPKAKTTVEKKVSQGPTKAAKTTVKVAPAKPKPAPKVQAPPPIDKPGLYPIKLTHGAGNLKALPLPGKRVLLIMPNSSVVVDNLEVVAEGNAFVLK